MDQTSYPNFVFGGDSSVWDDNNATPQRPNFLQAYNKGWRFNYLRTAFGLGIDSDYRQNWTDSRKTGLLLGNYHFLVWDQSPERQADFFWGVVKDDPGELPLICDFEWWSTIPSNAFDLLYRFLEQLKKNIIASGKTLKNGKPIRLGIYTAPAFWKQYGKTDLYWAQYVLWLAHYNDTAPLSAEIPAPWKKCDFWQFTGHGDGLLYGMESKDVDLDFYMGSLADLQQLCGLPITTDQGNVPMTNAIGLYTDNANWTNTGFDFIAGFAGKSWLDTPANLKAIDEKASAEGKPFFAWYEFSVDFYSRMQYMAKDEFWPPVATDEPLQKLILVMQNRNISGVVISVRDNTNQAGKIEQPAYISYAAKTFVGRANDWLKVHKPNVKLMVASSDEFISTKSPDMNNWIGNYNSFAVQPAIKPLINSLPDPTDKPAYLDNRPTCEFWRYYEYPTKADALLTYRMGDRANLWTWLKFGVVTPPPPDTGTGTPPTPIDPTIITRLDNLEKRAEAFESRFAALVALLQSAK